MMGFDWKAALGKVAPGLAALVGGPLAGMATTAICEVFGLNSDADEDAISSALSRMTPEQAVALKVREKELAVELKKVDVDIYKAEVADRKSARDREAMVGSTAIVSLAFIIIIGFLFMVWGLLSGYLNAVSGTTAGVLIGYVSAKAEQVVAYFFGSSFGSARKTELAVQQAVKGGTR